MNDTSHQLIEISITDNNEGLFQVSVLVKMLALHDISWWTSDIHSLMTSLCLIHLENLEVATACKLRPSPPSASPKARVKVDYTGIQASLSMDTLVALLSYIEVDVLVFYKDSHVLDMASYPPPPPQVSH